MMTFYGTASRSPEESKATRFPNPRIYSASDPDTICPVRPLHTGMILLDGYKKLRLGKSPADEDDKGLVIRIIDAMIASTDIDELFMSTFQRRIEICSALEKTPGGKDSAGDVLAYAAELFQDLELDMADDKSKLKILEFAKAQARPQALKHTGVVIDEGEGPNMKNISLFDLSDLAETLAAVSIGHSPVSSRSSSATFRSVNQRRALRPHRGEHVKRSRISYGCYGGQMSYIRPVDVFMAATDDAEQQVMAPCAAKADDETGGAGATPSDASSEPAKDVSDTEETTVASSEPAKDVSDTEEATVASSEPATNVSDTEKTGITTSESAKDMSDREETDERVESLALWLLGKASKALFGE